jgi:hypothetical protein
MNNTAENTQEQPGALAVRADSDVRLGRYSNLVNLTHTAEEVILDFILNRGGQLELVSRVVLSPAHARRLADVLSKSVTAAASQAILAANVEEQLKIADQHMIERGKVGQQKLSVSPRHARKANKRRK